LEVDAADKTSFVFLKTRFFSLASLILLLFAAYANATHPLVEKEPEEPPRRHQSKSKHIWLFNCVMFFTIPFPLDAIIQYSNNFLLQ
jgi:hypothetical protein